MIGETITIRRRVVAGEDDQGNPTYDTADIPVPHCAFAPTSSADDVATSGSRAITGGTVYAPSGTAVEPSDLFIIRGQFYAVDGEPGQWTSPYTGVGRGVEVAVKRAV